MRMIFTDHVADDARGFLVRLAVLVPQFVHGEEDAALHGFQAIADVGKRPPYNHAHRVVEVTLAHLVLDGAGLCLLLEQVHGVVVAPWVLRTDAAGTLLQDSRNELFYHNPLEGRINENTINTACYERFPP